MAVDNNSLSQRYWTELRTPAIVRRLPKIQGLDKPTFLSLKSMVEDDSAVLVGRMWAVQVLPPFADLPDLLRQSPRYQDSDVYKLKDWELLYRADGSCALLIFVFAYVDQVPKQHSDYIDRMLIEGKLGCRCVVWYYRKESQ